MAYEALGWFGNKCGVDFGGKKQKGGENVQNDGGPELQQQQRAQPVGGEGFFTKMNDAVFGTNDTSNGGQDSNSNAFANIQDGHDGPVPPPLPPNGTMPVGPSQSSSNTGNAVRAHNVDSEGVPVDEQGLPLERNYFFYNKDKGIWDVSDDAPESVKREHAAKLQELTAPKAPLPPPPPPPPGMMIGGGFPGSPSPASNASPTTPQYANDGFFSPMPPPPAPGLPALGGSPNTKSD